MRFAFIATFFAFLACASTAGEISLQCADCPEAQVDRIIDGHTLDTPRGRIRLFGVDTPERGQPCSDQAAQRLQQLLDDAVRVEPGPRSVDSFGRLLYYAYTRGGISVDATLITEGLGVASRLDGQHRDYLVRLETEARTESVGCLWRSTDLDYGHIADTDFNALVPDPSSIDKS